MEAAHWQWLEAAPLEEERDRAEEEERRPRDGDEQRRTGRWRHGPAPPGLPPPSPPRSPPTRLPPERADQGSAAGAHTAPRSARGDAGQPGRNLMGAFDRVDGGACVLLRDLATGGETESCAALDRAEHVEVLRPAGFSERVGVRVRVNGTLVATPLEVRWPKAAVEPPADVDGVRSWELPARVLDGGALTQVPREAVWTSSARVAGISSARVVRCLLLGARREDPTRL